MNKITIAVAGAALGAGAMFLFDPSRGRRRRARLGEAAVHISHRARAVAGMTARDAGHRLHGLAARTLARVAEEAPSDEVLVERVRARLGRLVSHPGAIDVNARAGRVTLKGPVFDAELDQLLEGVAAVAGVTAVENRLEPHGEAEGVSSLQGPGPLTRGAPAAVRLRGSPTGRLIAGVAGLALLARALSSKRPVRAAVTGITGVELISRAVLGSRAS
jgi:hypothetical protein